MRSLVLLSLCVTIICADTFAYQFNDLRWGSAIDELHNKLKLKDKQNIIREKDVIKYDDTVFGAHCRIMLYFTPKSKLLAQVLVSWPAPAPRKGIKQALVADYGFPKKSDNTSQEYIWYGTLESDEDKVMMKRVSDDSVKVTYYGGEMWRKFLQESR